MMNTTLPAIPKSTPSSISWPAVPSGSGAVLLGLQYQLEQTQWWPREIVEQLQLQQIVTLLKHAYETVPFYRERLTAVGFDPEEALTAERFTQLPLLRRVDVQAAGETLHSTRPPADHGKVVKGKTSGSTGRPIHYAGTQLTKLFHAALSLRDHLWHRRDFSGKHAIIRARVDQTKRNGWGPATDPAFESGMLVALDIRTDLETQLRWLQEENPDYLLAYTTNAQALARLCLERGITLSNLRQVRTVSETLNPEVRELCRAAWGVGIADMYSAAEIGYIALQCPEHEHYHVQSETVLVEVLDADGQACRPGEIGRVVLTSLHNFAMPLIRYEIMDYAEVGAPCPCGRTLPVLNRILGRERHLLTLPDGRQNWPMIGQKQVMDAAPIQQMQVIQRSLETIEVKLVTPRPLTAAEQTRCIDIFHTCLGHPFQIVFSYHEDIPRSAGGKFEDFVSEVTAPGNVPPVK